MATYFYTGKGYSDDFRLKNKFVKRSGKVWRKVDEIQLYGKERTFDQRTVEKANLQTTDSTMSIQNSSSSDDSTKEPQFAQTVTEPTGVNSARLISSTITFQNSSTNSDRSPSQNQFQNSNRNSNRSSNQNQIIGLNGEYSPSDSTAVKQIIGSNEENSPRNPTEVKKVSFINLHPTQEEHSVSFINLHPTKEEHSIQLNKFGPEENIKEKRIKWRRLCCWVLILGCIIFVLFSGILATIFKNNELLHEEINNNKVEVSALTSKINSTKYEISALSTEVNKTKVRVSTIFTENNTKVELSALYKQINDTKVELSRLLTEQNNTKVDVTELFAEVNNTKVRVSALFTEINSIKLEISALKSHLNLNTTQSCKCIASCINIPDGDYQSCSTCNGYISCVNQKGTERQCAKSSPPLQWDDETKHCMRSSTTCC